MHGAGHISRAVLEGVLMNLREILEVCVEAGLQTDQIIASGGATKERLWLQLLADVLGREVVTVTGASEGGAYGAALAAGVGSRGLAGPVDGAAARCRWSARSRPIRTPRRATSRSSRRTGGCTRRSRSVYALVAARR